MTTQYMRANVSRRVGEGLTATASGKRPSLPYDTADLPDAAWPMAPRKPGNLAAT